MPGAVAGEPTAGLAAPAPTDEVAIDGFAIEGRTAAPARTLPVVGVPTEGDEDGEVSIGFPTGFPIGVPIEGLETGAPTVGLPTGAPIKGRDTTVWEGSFFCSVAEVASDPAVADPQIVLRLQKTSSSLPPRDCPTTNQNYLRSFEKSRITIFKD